MIVRTLSLTNFKNHYEKQFVFSSKINCFVGNNGVGKTNILDALYYLSVGKSFLNSSDNQNLRIEEENLKVTADFFSIDALVETEETEDQLKVLLPKDAKKVIRKNEKAYDRLSDHVGYLPSVMISPYDANLISDGGESRRRFLDAMISQTNLQYLHQLIHYQKALQQRNALLKFFAKNRTYDVDTLQIYDEPLTTLGTALHADRSSFITELNPAVQNFYEIISGGKETVNILYESHLNEANMASQLSDFLAKDRQLTYTSRGIHKDDLLLEMNGQPLKKYGSQGQQKSFLIALKLAQIERIKTLTGKSPILLLDDIFDKLDDKRVSQLITLINQQNFGQMFITDTHRERTENVVKMINEESKIFEIV